MLLPLFFLTSHEGNGLWLSTDWILQVIPLLRGERGALSTIHCWVSYCPLSMSSRPRAAAIPGENRQYLSLASSAVRAAISRLPHAHCAQLPRAVLRYHI